MSRQMIKRKPVRKAKKSSSSQMEAIAKRVMLKNTETKYLILNSTESTGMGGTLNSPQTSYGLNSLANGDEENQIDGLKVVGNMLDIRGSLQTAHQHAIYHKIFVLEYDKQSNPLNDLLEDNAGAFAPAAQDLSAIYARVNTKKYKVLATRILKTGTVSNTANDFSSSRLFHISVKTRGVFNYDESSTAPTKRRIAMLMISRRADNDPTNIPEPVEWSWNSKWYYKDV